MSFWGGVEKVASEFDVKKKVPGYFSVSVFRVAFVLLLFLAVYVMYDEGLFDGNRVITYIECPKDAIGGRCHNPLYGATGPVCSPPDICEIEFLWPGMSMGKKPSVLYDWFGVLMAAVLGLAFLVNHVLYEWRKGLW